MIGVRPVSCCTVVRKVRVHEISEPAFERAADPDAYPELGDPWQPSKLYHVVWSRVRMMATHEKLLELGITSPYDDKWMESDPYHFSLVRTLNEAVERSASGGDA